MQSSTQDLGTGNRTVLAIVAFILFMGRYLSGEFKN